jgi:hypothetical protein
MPLIIRRNDFAAQSKTADAQFRPYFENNLLIVGGHIRDPTRSTSIRAKSLFTALLYTITGRVARFRVKPTI